MGLYPNHAGRSTSSCSAGLEDLKQQRRSLGNGMESRSGMSSTFASCFVGVLCPKIQISAMAGMIRQPIYLLAILPGGNAQYPRGWCLPHFLRDWA